MPPPTEQRRLCEGLFRNARSRLLLACLLTLSGQFGAFDCRPSAAAAAEISAPAAGQALREGEALLKSWTEESLRAAIVKFSAARAAYLAAHDRRGAARALSLTGDVHLILSEYRQALDSYGEALKLSRSDGDRGAEIKSLNDLSLIYSYLGEVKRALKYCRRAQRLSRDAGDRVGEAWALTNMGDAYYFSGDMREARAASEKALALWRADDWLGRSQTLLNLGYVKFDLREMDEATEHYSEALSIFRAANHSRGEALALTALGGIDSYLGSRQAALDKHNRAVKLFRAMGDRNGEAVALNGLGYVYRELGEYQKALDCYTRAQQFFKVLGNREYEDFTTIRVGNSYQGMGESRKAIECYRQTLSRFSRYSQTRANALNFIGIAYDSLGETQKSLGHYRRALGIYRAIADKMGEASALGNIGNAYYAAGMKDEALGYFRQELAQSRAVRNSSGELAALFDIARVLRDRGELAEGRAEIEAAIHIIESQRHQVTGRNLRASYSASVQQYYEVYIDLLMRLHRERPGAGLDELALQASEQARARSLLDVLQGVRENIRAGAESAALDRAHTLSLRLGQLYERETSLLGGKHTEEQAASLAAEIRALAREYDEVESEGRAQSPRYAALTRPPALGVKEIQRQVLEDGDLLLEYSLGEQRSYMWVVTGGGVTAHELPGRKEIEDLARAVYQSLTARQRRPDESASHYAERVARADEEYWRHASALSAMLLDPVADRLGSKRLLLVLDGALQYVPFGALPAPARARGAAPAGAASGADAAVPLLVLQEIVYLPSASIQAGLLKEGTQRRDARGTVAVLADPVFEQDDPRLRPAAGAALLPAGAYTPAEQDGGAWAENGGGFRRLLSSRDEARAIVEAAPSGTALQALGFTANRAIVLGPRLSQYRIVHFATHAVIDSRHPELTYLVLSSVDERGQKQDGLLLLGDIYNLHLPVEMVVLSACNTGLGKDIRGEGVVGLARGFMYAGASSVVASLWTIDDEATAELMSVFYRRMLIDGRPRAAALREAQLHMWEQKRWRAPYYWASFVLQGDYRPESGAGASRAREAVVAAPFVLLLMAGGLFALRRRRRGADLGAGR